ncbi:MAG: KEOPS complex subunit Pcc1 [Candidatus Ranarchaeia archaeon]
MVIRKIESHVTLTFKDEKLARVIEESLKPEIEMDIGQRSNTTMSRKKNSITINITAPDATSMRASMNSLLRWVSMIQRIHNI